MLQLLQQRQFNFIIEKSLLTIEKSLLTTDLL